MNRRKLIKALKRIRNLPKRKYFFFYILNKGKYLFLKLVRSTRVAYPSTIMLELTNHCNLHCITCPREYNYGRQMDKGFISFDQVEKIINEVWPYLDSIGLTGMGETFLYKDIERVVDLIKSKNRGIIISLSTNAVIPGFLDAANGVVNKIDTIQVSIDGLDTIYEQIRRNGDFDLFQKNLKGLVALCQNTETAIMLNMVITRENYHQMHSMVSFAKSMGVKYLTYTPINLVAINPIGKDYYQFFDSMEFNKEIALVKDSIRKHPDVQVSLWDFNSKNNFKRCPFPWTHFYITWNGYLVPCCSKPFPKELHFGNVFDQGLKTCLNSAAFKSMRINWFENKPPVFCSKCHFIDLGPNR